MRIIPPRAVWLLLSGEGLLCLAVPSQEKSIFSNTKPPPGVMSRWGLFQWITENPGILSL